MIPNFPDFIFLDDSSIERDQVPNVVRSDMDIGPAKTRPIQSVGFFNISFSVSICEDKLFDFRKWYNKDLKYGANWFIMNDPLDGVERRFRFLEYNNRWQKRGSILINRFTLEAYDEL